MNLGPFFLELLIGNKWKLVLMKSIMTGSTLELLTIEGLPMNARFIVLGRWP